MRLILLLILIGNFIFSVGDADGQPKATLYGTVKSLDGSTLPASHIVLKPLTENLFFGVQKLEVDKDGSYLLSIPKSGVYRVSIYGVMHKQVHFPLWIREPDSLSLHIRLDPKNLDDGQYFKDQEYISWIRVTGNFNGYNYGQGVRFKRIAPKTLQATFTTGLDTLYYQIVGITSGTTVLPGAADYRLRSSNDYEAIVPVVDNKVVITYKADSTYFDNKNPFEGYRTTWDYNQSEIQYADQIEERIQNNLKKVNLLARLLFHNKMFDADSVSRDKFEYTVEQHYRKTWNLNLDDIETLEKRINNLPKGTNEHLLQSMYYKYLLLSEEIVQTHASGLLEEIDTTPKRYINADILYAAMDAIPPSSSLWSLYKELILTLPEYLGFSNRVSSYLEEAVMKNPDNDVTGRVLFRLFTHAFDSGGNSEKAKKYYRLILEAFGDNYYARKARDYVHSKE